MYKDISFWLNGKECKCGDYVKLTSFGDKKMVEIEMQNILAGIWMVMKSMSL